jgi:hypothetical protein
MNLRNNVFAGSSWLGPSPTFCLPWRRSRVRIPSAALRKAPHLRGFPRSLAGPPDALLGHFPEALPDVHQVGRTRPRPTNDHDQRVHQGSTSAKNTRGHPANRSRPEPSFAGISTARAHADPPFTRRSTTHLAEGPNPCETAPRAGASVTRADLIGHNPRVSARIPLLSCLAVAAGR